jgi:hypothetical protein
MCVRPACYLPSSEPSPREFAARLIARRNLATLAELAALAVFLRTVWIWAAVGAGA